MMKGYSRTDYLIVSFIWLDGTDRMDGEDDVAR